MKYVVMERILLFGQKAQALEKAVETGEDISFSKAGRGAPVARFAYRDDSLI